MENGYQDGNWEEKTTWRKKLDLNKLDTEKLVNT